jgi:ribosomal protein RSM22 (predicted rRNA methylase)
MNLPIQLQQAIALEAEKFCQKDILSAREVLTERYADSESPKEALILTEAERCAYVVSRMPATYAVVLEVLRELERRHPQAEIRSLLDLGAGPGTAMWAAAEAFPSLQEINLIERDSQLIALGKRLALQGEMPAFHTAQWQVRNMEQFSPAVQHDLVVLSYSVGELPEASIAEVIEKSWQATSQYLVVIEPGTPAGFERIRTIRNQLIGLNAFMVAPCPHMDVCPMTDGNWCHFSERIERSSLHRRIKLGALGYEDEKFSYVIFSKTQVSLPEARILRHPQKRSGHVILSLCTKAEGLKQQTVSKRTPELYKLARKLDWGDSCM